jgi:hypothetical protein
MFTLPYRYERSCRLPRLKDLDGLNWTPITRDEIHIIVHDTVNLEIDKLKEDARSRPGGPL